MNEPTEAGLGPADDDDVEQAENYRRQRAVDEAMAVYSTDDSLVEHQQGDALEEEKYGEGDRPARPLREDPPAPESRRD